MACVLVAVDADDAHERVLDTVEDIFDEEDTSVLVKHFLFSEPTEEEKLLRTTVENWADRVPVQVTVDFVSLDEVEASRIAEDVAVLLTDYSSDFDYVVIGTRQESGLHRLLHGQTAVNLVKRAECPVLVVPTPDNRLF